MNYLVQRDPSSTSGKTIDITCRTCLRPLLVMEAEFSAGHALWLGTVVHVVNGDEHLAPHAPKSPRVTRELAFYAQFWELNEI